MRGKLGSSGFSVRAKTLFPECLWARRRCWISTCCNLFFFFFGWLILEREGKWGSETEGEKRRFVVPLIYSFTGCCLYVLWPGIDLAALAYGGDVPTNQAPWPGPDLCPNVSARRAAWVFFSPSHTHILQLSSLLQGLEKRTIFQMPVFPSQYHFISL